MSDSGFTQFPSGPRGLEQTRRAARGSEPNAKIVNTPRELRNLRSPVRISGEVTRQNRDGSVRVRTDHGDIDVRLNNPNNRENPPPQRGQEVELQIPAGRPPVTARVEVVQPQTTTAQTANPQPLPQSVETTVPVTTPVTTPAATPRITATPLELNILQNEAQQNIFTPPAKGQQIRPFPLLESIRIEPITREQALNFITSPLETFFAKITETPSPLTQILPILSIVSQTQKTQTIPAFQTTKNSPIFEFLQTQAQTPILNQNIFEPFTQNIKQANSAIIEFFTPEPAQILQNKNFAITVNTGLLQTVTANSITTPALNTITAALNIFESNPTPEFVQNKPFFSAQITRIDQPLPDFKFTDEKTPQQTLKETQQNLITHNQQAQQSIATLIAQTPQSLPVFASFPAVTSEGFFFIAHAPADTLSIGAQVIISPDIITSATSSYAALQAAPLTSYFLTPDIWSTLDEIHQTLLQSAPSIAQAMANVTPSPANLAQMSNALLFFVAAIRSGDLPGWLGQRALDALRDAGKSKSISRLGLEGDALFRLASEPVSQDWRALSLPMLWQNEIHKIALYYKHDEGDENSDPNGQKPTRFLFDLKLDKMGPVQLDGWYKDKRLDLIVRTEQSFSETARQNMRKLYADGLKQTQITGELTFQNQLDAWVKIIPDERNLGMDV